jgi:hypothetical protein
MTNINLVPFESKMPSKIPAAGLVSALLITSLIAVGCSKPNSPVSQIPTPTNQAILNPPSIIPDNTGTLAPASAPDKKKEVRKQHTTVTYKDRASGLSFRYPWIYAQKTGKQSDVVASGAMNFGQPGGRPKVSIVLPTGLYPGTDLTSAFFRVNVNKKSTADECSQFGLPQSSSSSDEELEATNPALEGLQLQEVEENQETRHTDTRYYHVFKNDVCYEFALGVAAKSGEDDDEVRPVNSEKVFSRLEAILETVEIESRGTPAVVGQSPAPPPAEDIGDE